jgi:hypothetical protein
MGKPLAVFALLPLSPSGVYVGMDILRDCRSCGAVVVVGWLDAACDCEAGICSGLLTSWLLLFPTASGIASIESGPSVLAKAGRPC